jgi:hypothetical protein
MTLLDPQLPPSAHRRRLPSELTPWIRVALLCLAGLAAIRIASDRSRSGSGSGDDHALAPAVLVTELEGLKIHAWRDRTAIGPHQRATFWLTVENTADRPVAELSLAAVEAGDLVRDPAIPARFPALLAPGGAATAEVALTSRSATGLRTLNGRLSWRAAPGEPPSEARFPLGTLVVRRPPPVWRGPAESVYQVVKDLGLPIALGLLAYLYQRLQQARSEASQAERDRQQAREEVRGALFKRVHQSSILNYMPIVSEVMGLTGTAPKVREDPPGELLHARKSLAFFLNLRLRMRELMEKEGGLFLGRRIGEEFVQRCWSVTLYRGRRRLGPEEFDAVVATVDLERVPVLLNPVAERVGSETASGWALKELLADQLGRWSRWMRAEESELDLAVWNAFAAAIEFESNLLYDLWYEERDAPPSAVVAALRGALDRDFRRESVERDQKEDRRMEELRECVERYHRHLAELVDERRA